MIKHEEIVNRIKDIGLNLINKAEEYAGDTAFISSLCFICDVDICNEIGPRINVHKEYLPKEFVERLGNND